MEGGYIPRTAKPSFSAASLRRRSSVTKNKLLGFSSQAIRAAASCKESAARRGWISSNLRARSLTFSARITSDHRRSNCASCSFDLLNSAAAKEFSLLRRANADTTSTGVSNQTRISVSSANSFRQLAVSFSQATSGTTAEASQNLTAPHFSRREVPPGPARLCRQVFL